MTTQSATLKHARALIQRPSVTPHDAGCQAYLRQHLEPLGFNCEDMPFGEVTNLWARRGQQGPLLVFAGHTDVVPTGPEEAWAHPPFEAVVENGVLHGRGAADMKGSLAAFLTACERFISRHPDHKGSVAWLITSDEEGRAVNGTVKVVKALRSRNEIPDWCIVGEPSSTRTVGDVIKNGRRGSLTGRLTVKGIQGHVAYPHLADNPIHRVAPVLAELTQVHWDDGNDFFPATSFQISNIHGGTGAGNVIPGEVVIDFNFRFSTESTDETLRNRVIEVLNRHNLTYEMEWTLFGQPFLTDHGPLVDAVVQAIHEERGFETVLSTSGGTSDGRYIAPMGTQVVELGPINKTIHRVNEQVSVAELDQLSRIYERILEHLLL